jgi:hypothetical protein
MGKDKEKKLKKKCCKKYKKKAVHCTRCPKTEACVLKMKMAKLVA